MLLVASVQESVCALLAGKNNPYTKSTYAFANKGSLNTSSLTPVRSFFSSRKSFLHPVAKIKDVVIDMIKIFFFMSYFLLHVGRMEFAIKIRSEERRVGKD